MPSFYSAPDKKKMCRIGLFGFVVAANARVTHKRILQLSAITRLLLPIRCNCRHDRTKNGLTVIRESDGQAVCGLCVLRIRKVC